MMDGRSNLTPEDIARVSAVRAEHGVPDAPPLRVTRSDGSPPPEHADHVVAPDPLDEIRPVAACLPNDADDRSDAGDYTTDHADEGWRAEPLAKP